MKMNAKKVLGMVLAGVLAAGSLTACGGSSTADTTAEATEAQGDKAASTAASGELSLIHIYPLSHTRGAISMARSQIKDSASSQFFIVHEDSTFLDGEYACFGYVTEGMEVVDAICQATKVEDNNGTVARENQPVIESVEVID